MPKYLVLYLSSVSARDQLANATPEEAQAGMQAWMDWAEQSGDAIVDLGAPLGESREISSGPASGDNSQITGFSILEADSGDAVTQLLAGHPHLQMPGGSSIEFFEFLPIPGEVAGAR
jgi:hypothetical protein